MIRHRLTSVVAIIAVTALLAGVAEARAIFIVHYSGQTSQKYRGKPSPSIAIDIDRTHGAVHYIGIAFRCTNSGKAWITRIYPSLGNGRISKRGDFKYTSGNARTRLRWISGHVTSRGVTGRFAATKLGCTAQGTYTARPAAR